MASTSRTPFSTADVSRRYRSAFDLVDELEALATRKRLDAQIHFAELACAAGLLLMTMMAFGLGRDGLAVRNARRLGADLDPVLLLHLVEDVAHMQITESAHHGFVPAVIDAKTRILGSELMQHLR